MMEKAGSLVLLVPRELWLLHLQICFSALVADERQKALSQEALESPETEPGSGTRRKHRP